MSAIKIGTVRVFRLAHRLAVVVVLITCLLFTSPALAAKKKKEEPAPTKSYVLPYFIVMMLVGVGLMTVCRPGSRKDRVEQKKKPGEE